VYFPCWHLKMVFIIFFTAILFMSCQFWFAEHLIEWYLVEWVFWSKNVHGDRTWPQGRARWPYVTPRTCTVTPNGTRSVKGWEPQYYTFSFPVQFIPISWITFSGTRDDGSAMHLIYLPWSNILHWFEFCFQTTMKPIPLFLFVCNMRLMCWWIYTKPEKRAWRNRKCASMCSV